MRFERSSNLSRYAGRRSWGALYTSTAILNCTRWQTGSQSSCCRTGVMCSQLLVLAMRRAAAFWTACRRCRWSRKVVSCSSLGVFKLMPGLATWRHQTTTSVSTDALPELGVSDSTRTRHSQALSDYIRLWTWPVSPRHVSGGQKWTSYVKHTYVAYIQNYYTCVASRVVYNKIPLYRNALKTEILKKHTQKRKLQYFTKFHVKLPISRKARRLSVK